MIWSEGDICEKLLNYVLVIFLVTYVHFLVLFYICIPGRKSGILRIRYGHAAAAEISFWTR